MITRIRRIVASQDRSGGLSLAELLIAIMLLFVVLAMAADSSPAPSGRSR